MRSKSWFDRFGTWTRTWRDAFSAVKNDCIYSQAQTENAFHQAFGDGLMLGETSQEQVVKVGVITSTTMGAEIITNYNKMCHKSNHDLLWAQGNGKHRNLRAWEA